MSHPSNAALPARSRRRQEVLRQLRAVTRLAQSAGPASSHDPLLPVLDAMTPEQLRKLHDGLAALVDCIARFEACRPAAAP
jgi:hypothetical protein